MANGFATVAQNFRDLAEYFDNLSEDARESAERTKADALKKVKEPFRRRLVDRLGEATTDQQRCDAVKQVIDEIQQSVDQAEALAQSVGGNAALEIVGETQEARDTIACLRAFHNDLVKIKTFETQRDAFRGVADAFAGM